MEYEKLAKGHGILRSVMEFYQFCPRIVLYYSFLVTFKKLSSDLESPHFPIFSAKRRKCKFRKRDGLGKSRNGHGKIFCQVCGNPALETMNLASHSTLMFDVPGVSGTGQTICMSKLTVCCPSCAHVVVLRIDNCWWGVYVLLYLL